ncbi:putative oxidoreductase [Nocardia nova SH22a]|uniref:Putative oxidoreductase n=1 Tax=Nocardia nova SH22a TaxID=1415166 RepID=W5TPH0_9NOCA|nr:flavin reductase family protein [Nocardia nova]AHH21039.1 putative oxidoreductase [Nocardia nova SH22a]
MLELLAERTDDRALRHLFATFPSGVVAVCAEIDGAPCGFAVSTLVPVSLDPPLMLFCVQRSSTTWPHLSTAERLGLSLLGADQHDAARALAGPGGERFRDLRVHRGDRDAVFIDSATCWVEGSVHSTVDAGDHLVVILGIHRTATRDGGRPLVFHDHGFRRLQETEAR